MAASRDRSTLRQLVGEVAARLGTNTHATLNEAFAKVGMPPSDEGTKHERVERSFAQVSDSDLPVVAQSLLAGGYANTAQRHRIEDLLWAESSPPEIPRRIRRELARSLDLADIVRNEGRFMALLERFWVLRDEMSSLVDAFFGSPGPSLRRDIEQHVLRNPGDWSAEDLMENIGAFEAGDARFARFLEELVSADVLLDETAQRHLVATINEHVRSAAIELRETGTEGGYPHFSMVSTRLAGNRKPKDIIFASITKPDIRFQSAMDNDIEIVGDPDKSLVYDRPTPAAGLRWRDLQAWWQEKHKFPTDADAKTSLYRQLRRSLPDNSPGQQNLFDCYHQILGTKVYDHPALLPEVWLHWDPRTVRARGPQALLRSRMDFLLLLPHGQRIVLEVDGSQHYTRDRGQHPDTAKYAQTMASDRDLKLRGYEVFRFGHDELKDTTAAQGVLEQFLPALFQRFDVTAGTF
ncbi:AbiJ-related protein [Streptomyces uncialis]|uniref:AbiJ-related protein n=1 Tax=Streptomyces uncialis TaxID=1048205 RepID=UPI00378EC3DA